jgi:hypothetical protein
MEKTMTYADAEHSSRYDDDPYEDHGEKKEKRKRGSLQHFADMGATVLERKLPGGTLKIALKLVDGSGKKKSGSKLNFGKFSNAFGKKASVAFSSFETEIFEIVPGIKVNLGMAMGSISADGGLSLAKMSVGFSGTLTKKQIASIFSDEQLDNLENDTALQINGKYEFELDPEDFKLFNNLKLYREELKLYESVVSRERKTLDALKNKRMMSQEKYVKSRLAHPNPGDTKNPDKLASKARREFKKLNQKQLDKVKESSKRLRNAQKAANSLKGKITSAQGNAKSPFLQRMAKTIGQKVAKFIARVAKFLKFSEIIGMVVKIAALMVLGAKFTLLMGKSLYDLTYAELAELMIKRVDLGEDGEETEERSTEIGTGKEEESGVDTQSLDNEESYDEIIATLTQLLEQYEQLPENASGAGSSLEKQEGNVHGYEQEEVTKPGESFTTKQTEIEEKGEEKSNIEVEEIENPTYIRNQDLVGDTKKVNVHLFCDYKSYMVNKNRIEQDVLLKVNIGSDKLLFVKFADVKFKVVIRKFNDDSIVCIDLLESIIAANEKYKIILKKGTCYKLNKLENL